MVFTPVAAEREDEGFLLAGISRGLTGFRPTSAAEYDELELEIEKAKVFDQPE